MPKQFQNSRNGRVVYARTANIQMFKKKIYIIFAKQQKIV